MTDYVTLDAFVEIRTRQDRHLRLEFGTLHESIDGVKQELKQFKDEFTEFKDEVKQFKDEVKEFKDEVKEFKDEFKEFKDEVNRRFDRIELESLRMGARFQNFILKNPYLMIKPVVAYHGDRGILEPDPNLFPRHAKEFYALRDPSTDRRRRVLAYLLSFYDVQLPPQHDSSENSDDDSGDALMRDAPIAIEVLEGILGLSEDNFVKFRERAQELATHQPPTTVTGKRSHATGGGEEVRSRPRQGVEPQQRAAPGRPRTKSPSSFGVERIQWGNRSTPSSQQPTINNLPKHRTVPIQRDDAATTPYDSGSPTNAFTSPRHVSEAGSHQL